MPVVYRPSFDTVRIDAKGTRIPLGTLTVNVDNVTTSTSLGTLVSNAEGVIAAGSHTANVGDVIEISHATYPLTCRFTLTATQAEAFTHPDNDVGTYIAENLHAQLSPYAAQVWVTDLDNPDIKKQFWGRVSAAATTEFDYTTTVDRNLRFHLLPEDTEQRLGTTDLSVAEAANLVVPGTGGVGSERVDNNATNFDDLIADAATAEINALLNDDVTVTGAKVVPANLIHRRTNNGRFIKGASGAIEFEGLGFTKADLEGQTALFYGFDPGDITWTGAVWPSVVSTELWASSGGTQAVEFLGQAVTFLGEALTFSGSEYTWADKTIRACNAFTDKEVTIQAHPGGSLTSQIEVFEKQNLYLTKGFYSNAWAGADVAQILLNSNTSLYGDGMGQTFLQESPAPATVRFIYSVSANTHPYDGTNDNIKVHDLTMYGNPVQRSNSEESAILLGNGKNHHIYRVEGYYIHGFFAYIGLFGTSGNYADGWSIKDCVSWGTLSQSIGIIMGKNGQISGNQFLDIQPCHYFVTDGVTNGTTTVTSATGTFNAAMAAANVKITKPGQTTHETTVASVTNPTTIILASACPFTTTGASIEMIGAFASVIDIEPSGEGCYVENVSITNNGFDGKMAQTFYHAIVVQATSVMAAKNIHIADNYAVGRDVVDVTFYSTDVSTGADTITIPDHQLETGQTIYFTTVTGSLPTGVTAGPIYAAIKVDNDTIKIAHSYGYAKAGTAIDLTAVGSGRHKIAHYTRMSSGIIADGLYNSQIVNNSIQGTSQAAIAIYNSAEMLVNDNKLLHVAGGGIEGMTLTACVDSRIHRNVIRSASGSGSTSNNILENEITTFTCNTSGTAVTLTGGSDRCRRWWEGKTVPINSVDYTVEAVRDPSNLILTSSAGTQTGVTLATKGFSSNVYRDNDVGTITRSANGTSLIDRGTVTIDPASVAANTVAEQTFTLSGVATGDSIVLNPPALTAGLLMLQVRVSAANQIAITFHNTTGSPIDQGSASWTYKVWR